MRPYLGGRRDPITLSVEIFPPAKAEGRARLAGDVVAVRPHYVSVTFGAGGTTRDRTFDMVDRLVHDPSIDVAAHLTCVGASRSDVDSIIRCYQRAGVRRIVALRGDPPGGLDVPYAPHPQGYDSTAALVGGISAIADFEVTVATYPEKHPQSPTVDTDLDLLAAKVDAGACRAITQFFFEPNLYHRHLERVRRRGISVPIIPGILPIQNFGQVRSFAAKCGATVPDWLAARFAGHENDPAAQAAIGADIAAAQITALAAEGADEFHIYCLNKPTVLNRLRALLPSSATSTRAA